MLIQKLIFAAATAFLLSTGNAYAAKASCSKQDDALDIYRLQNEILKEEKAQCEAEAKAPVTVAWSEYGAHYYKTASQLQDYTVETYRWQLYASNVLLWMVVLLTLSGTAFSGYQLYFSMRREPPAPAPGAGAAVPVAGAGGAAMPGGVDLELSKEKLRLQTSVIGIAVLIISWAFVLLFVREVYKITAPNTPPPVEVKADAPAAE